MRGRRTPADHALCQSRPSNKASNCVRVSRTTPLRTAGQANRRPSSRLYAGTRPVPSSHSTLILSARLALNTSATPRIRVQARFVLHHRSQPVMALTEIHRSARHQDARNARRHHDRPSANATAIEAIPAVSIIPSGRTVTPRPSITVDCRSSTSTFTAANAPGVALSPMTAPPACRGAAGCARLTADCARSRTEPPRRLRRRPQRTGSPDQPRALESSLQKRSHPTASVHRKEGGSGLALAYNVNVTRCEIEQRRTRCSGRWAVCSKQSPHTRDITIP